MTEKEKFDSKTEMLKKVNEIIIENNNSSKDEVELLKNFSKELKKVQEEQREKEIMNPYMEEQHKFIS